MAAPKAARIPSLIYGTAWKKDQTRALVKQALLTGFRGVDTAAQPKHYQEDLVGQGIRDAIAEGGLRREDLYIQTKFTSIHGQDPNKMPYNPEKSITNQVSSSVASSLHNLRHLEDPKAKSYLDCLVLHSPFPSMKDTQEAWRAMEIHVPQQVRTLGISNIYQLENLKALYDFATIKPSVVQNRFYPATGYDTAIRGFCAEKGMIYQSFWTLTGSPRLLQSTPVAMLAERVGVSKPVAVYGLVLGLGNTSILCGTTNSQRMQEDLVGVKMIKEWAEASPEVWRGHMKAFQASISV
ncbi:hypothetical protein LTR37_007324 [Vermiconidia calcicola]|uniref:Uncharacterized protein n=1 Tax=Vermiconidia calcicola TaxID=1690605 RepID=A0ACC3NF93_9PEZI|nr:hypothetical protein LTR37_007324 [Vermiconidia calcicola]